MKYAVAANKKDENSEISAMAARAPYFLIFNEKGELLEKISNPFAVGGGGAGFSVAKILADKNINCFVAENIGKNMAEALKERGVEYCERAGLAKQAIEEIVKK